VIDAAQAVAIPADQKILHILPQEYIIDSQEGIKEPLGMSGVRLEAKVHVVTCAVNSAQNIEKCVRRCGLEVEEIILEQLASSYAVLTDDERELGVCLVDIGGGTTDIAVFTEGAIRHTGVIPIAGDQVTNDIAVALRTPTQYAEEIKIRYACALAQLAGADETIKVPECRRPPARVTCRGRRWPRSWSRATTSCSRWCGRRSAAAASRSMLAGGIVLTGGTSKMEGVVELAEEIFHMPVRLGSTAGVHGMADIVEEPDLFDGCRDCCCSASTACSSGPRRCQGSSRAGGLVQSAQSAEAVVPAQFVVRAASRGWPEQRRFFRKRSPKQERDHV
jgi:cell division protein FtsA